MNNAVIQYGVQLAPGLRPEGPFPNREAAEDWLAHHPRHGTPQTPPKIVSRVILTGDWTEETE